MGIDLIGDSAQIEEVFREMFFSIFMTMLAKKTIGYIFSVSSRYFSFTLPFLYTQNTSHTFINEQQKEKRGRKFIAHFKEHEKYVT